MDISELIIKVADNNNAYLDIKENSYLTMQDVHVSTEGVDSDIIREYLIEQGKELSGKHNFDYINEETI
jgi:hypothetical protein